MTMPEVKLPSAYRQGWVEYRGRRFFVDQRVFITDPETGHMLDAVVAHLRRAREYAVDHWRRRRYSLYSWCYRGRWRSRLASQGWGATRRE